MAGAKGFTLLELIIVMALIGLMMATALPEYFAWRAQARYRDAAQGIASTLREARARALSNNVQHRVEFDLANRQYRVLQGNRTIGSTSFGTVIKDWTVFTPDITLRGAADCTGTTDVNLDLNANGTGTQDGVCIMASGAPLTAKYRVGIQLATTGRVVVTKL